MATSFGIFFFRSSRPKSFVMMGLRSIGPYLWEGKSLPPNIWPIEQSSQRHRWHLVCQRMGKQLGHTGEFFRRRDEWRKHPMLTKQLRHATPGLGIALVAFGIYLVGEQVYNRMSKPSSSHHH